MSTSDYLRAVVDEDRQKAESSPILFLTGRTLSGASLVALFMLGSDALSLISSPAEPGRRLVLALTIGAALALRALWVARWRRPEPLARG